MRLAIMQPYFFPYIGYFQLINAVDKLIFYDDVNFIKNGWINRNKVLVNGKSHYITIQLKNASSFSPINQVEFNDNRNKIKKTIEQSYKKAPFFKTIFPIIEECLSVQTNKIGELAIHSIIATSNYLELNKNFEVCSNWYSDTKLLERSDRLIEICKLNKVTQYINPIGGINIYSKDEFMKRGIKLNFLKSKQIEYLQSSNIFQPCLSIIDVMMFNSKETVNNLLDQYELI